MALNFFKVATLPGSLTADSFYYVENGTYAESYVTDTSGVAHAIGNSAMINALAGAVVTSALADYNTVEIVADIAARNALTLARNTTVLVLDASADATVDSGSALYAYRESDTSWIKLTEYESVDVALTWANLSGKPSSAPSQIDDAVAKRHTHANSAELAKIGEADGAMTYDGDPVGAPVWSTTAW